MKTLVSFCLVLVFSGVLNSQTRESSPQPVVLSAQVKHGEIIYQLKGKRVENSVQNSLLKNLTKVLDARGSGTSVFVVVDVRAPFSEFGKLETALDKVGLPNRKFFVTNFSDATMNEIHWDEKAVPIPQD